MDGAMNKAPCGGVKAVPNLTDRGEDGVKRSLLTEGHGVPLGLVGRSEPTGYETGAGHPGESRGKAPSSRPARSTASHVFGRRL